MRIREEQIYCYFVTLLVDLLLFAFYILKPYHHLKSYVSPVSSAIWNLVRERSSFLGFKNMGSLVFYTSENLLFRYGKLTEISNCWRVFVANLVFPMEPSRLINLDEVLEKISCFKHTALSFVIENHGILKVGIYYSDRTIPYLKKILSGEIRLKSRYCSEIFFYEGAVDNDNLYDLVVYEENNPDRLCFLPRSENQNSHRIGYIFKRAEFLKKITSPNFNIKVVDIYCTIVCHSRVLETLHF
ncbi:UNVERIFIED_CONTAM: hypothetical protein RMT77_012030 [Armadillidium vulgare]